MHSFLTASVIPLAWTSRMCLLLRLARLRWACLRRARLRQPRLLRARLRRPRLLRAGFGRPRLRLAHLGHELPLAPPDLLGREVLLVGGETPHMPEGVRHFAEPVSPEHVGQ